MRKKNIMLLIGYLSNGGAEKSIVKLANELTKNHHVYLVVANNQKNDYLPNCKVIEVKELRRRLTKLIGIIKVKRLKRKFKIDTSISYTTVFNFINIITRRHDKVIISIRNYLSLKEKNLLYRLLHKYSLKKGDLVVCCSKAVYYDQIKNYHADIRKIKVIENFYDENIVKSLSKEKVLENNYIMTIARLEKHKGLIELIKAFEVVVKKNSNIKLLIFGRGPLKDELLSLIRNNHLEDKVFLMGFTNNIYKYLSSSLCFILTSYYEGFSNSIIEALACKTPVIAYNSPGGNSEILSDIYYNENRKRKKYYGILLDSLEINNIAKSIIDVINNQDEYKRKSFIRGKRYTTDKIIGKWYDII